MEEGFAKMKCWNALTAVMLCFCLGGIVTAEELDAKSIWSPEVEEMYSFGDYAPSWVTEESSELTVVRGVAGSEEQSALSIAIRDIILPRVVENLDSPWTDHEKQVATAEIVRRLHKSDIILEAFEQPFYKDVDGEKYEAFSREAILCNFSDEKMAYLHRAAHRAVHDNAFMRRNTQRASLGIVGALFVFCWLAYWILDRLTRGYYVGLLRVMAAAVFLISAGLTVHVARVILSTL